MTVEPRTARAELGQLLRSRRERLTPADVGLPPGPRRRAPGLRREEVARLASVSPTYYAFLEQGRDVTPSGQVLDALAAALLMSGAERALLHELTADAAPDLAGERLADGLASLVDHLSPRPAYVKGRRWDVLASNPAARALLTDWPTLPAGERNVLWFMFTDPRARSLYVEWEHEASALLARFRAIAVRRPDDPSFTELIERLHAVSPEVRAWWTRRAVLPALSGTKRFRHPSLGEVTLQHTVLLAADAPEQKLVTYSWNGSGPDPLPALTAGG